MATVPTQTPQSQTPSTPQPTFHVFAALPTELRRQIWHHALPPPRAYYLAESLESSLRFHNTATSSFIPAAYRAQAGVFCPAGKWPTFSPPEAIRWGDHHLTLWALRNACKEAREVVEENYVRIITAAQWKGNRDYELDVEEEEVEWGDGDGPWNEDFDYDYTSDGRWKGRTDFWNGEAHRMARQYYVIDPREIVVDLERDIFYVAADHSFAFEAFTTGLPDIDIELLRRKARRLAVRIDALGMGPRNGPQDRARGVAALSKWIGLRELYVVACGAGQEPCGFSEMLEQEIFGPGELIPWAFAEYKPNFEEFAGIEKVMSAALEWLRGEMEEGRLKVERVQGVEILQQMFDEWRWYHCCGPLGQENRNMRFI